MENNHAEKSGSAVMTLLKCLLASYVLTAVLLLALAGLLWKLGLGEKTVRGAIIVIYVVSNFAGGYLAGKFLRSRKFLWGLLNGIAYFVVLAIMSLVVNGDSTALGDAFFTTLVLCAGGGMLGGMLGG